MTIFRKQQKVRQFIMNELDKAREKKEKIWAYLLFKKYIQKEYGILPEDMYVKDCNKEKVYIARLLVSMESEGLVESYVEKKTSRPIPRKFYTLK